MIELDNVTKFYAAGGARKYILRDASLTLPRRNIAVLGVNGAGKSTLIRLLAGTELPDRGEVRRRVQVSWPLGFTGGFNGSLTGRENLKFVARIYDRPLDGVVDYVTDFAELGAYLDMPVKTYSSGMRARLAFALSMAIDFDCYLVDEITAVGDARFQQRCAEAFARKRERAQVVMVSHRPATLRAYCDIGGVLHDGHFELFDSVEAAEVVYSRLMRNVRT